MNLSGRAQQLRHLARFAIVGAFNTGVAYGIYAIFLRLGVIFWLANLISLAFGILISFITQGSFVFFNRDKRRFGRFVVTWLSIYLIQTSFIGLLVAHGYDASLSGIIVLPGTVVLSYLVQKYFVFGARKSNAPAES